MAGFLILLTTASFALAMFLTMAMMPLSHRLGLIALPGGRRIHGRPTPKGGGVAIFLAIWLPVIIGALYCLHLFRTGNQVLLYSGLDQYVEGVTSLLPRLGAIFLGGVIVWLTGLADDRWDVSPWIRLLIEFGVAFFLVFMGVRASIFLQSNIISTIVTVLWIVGLINAFNMLDNMDGLSAGVGAIIALFFVVVAFQTEHYFVGAFMCCVLGALGGFLLFNFPPANIFMGDSGSTTIGYTLAVMTVEFTFFQESRPYFPIIMPLLMFGLPLFDTITVVWIRLRSGRSPFVGDTNHFSHRLVALGMTRRQAVLTIYLVTATVALGATVLYYANTMAVWVIFAQTLAVFTIIGILESARPDKTSEQRTTPPDPT